MKGSSTGRGRSQTVIQVGKNLGQPCREFWGRLALWGGPWRLHMPPWSGNADCPQKECGTGEVSSYSCDCPWRSQQPKLFVGLIPLSREGKGSKTLLSGGPGQHISMLTPTEVCLSLYFFQNMAKKPIPLARLSSPGIKTLHRSSLYNIQPSKFRLALTSFL